MLSRKVQLPLFGASVFAALSLGAIPAALGQDREVAVVDKMIVFDGSGSMWGQIDGEAKILIARRTITGLLADMPDKGALGLTVYGHRVKGDCGDIETLVAPAPVSQNRALITKAVEEINPKGKTPLSAAVIEAAKALRHTENAATVILISDGKETCELDPCDIARQLENDGVDFTAHVIGFDVANPDEVAQLQCLAENTGGQYFSASNASELAQALEKVSGAEQLAPSTDDFADASPEPTALFFEETFDGEQLKPHWQLVNRSDPLFRLQGGHLIGVGPGEPLEFWREKVLNRFVLDHPLPEEDFDVQLEFKILAQTGGDEAVVGLASGDGSMVMASLFFSKTGCGIEPLLYITSAKGKDGAERSEFVQKVFDAVEFERFCRPGATEPADMIASFAENNASIILQKRGRNFAARLEMDWPAYGDKASRPVTVSTKPLTLLRSPEKASFMVGQRVQQGETVLIADRFSIEKTP